MARFAKICVFFTIWGIISPNLGAQTPAVQVYSQFGGINNYVDSTKIDDADAQDAANIITDNGSLQVIPGNVRIGTVLAGYPVSFLMEFLTAGGLHSLIAQSSTTLYAQNAGGTFVAIATVTANTTLSATQGLGSMWFTNGTDIPFSYDGANTTTATNMPLCKFLEFYQDRLFCANVSTETSKLYVSEYADATVWAISSSTGIATEPYQVFWNKDDGEQITCMKKYQDGVYIGKPHSSYVLKGQDADTFYKRQVSANIGCVDNRSVQVLGGTLIWLGADCVYQWSGSSDEPVCISRAIDNTVKAINQSTNYTQTFTIDSKGDWENGSYSTTTFDTAASSGILRMYNYQADAFFTDQTYAYPNPPVPQNYCIPVEGSPLSCFGYVFHGSGFNMPWQFHNWHTATFDSGLTSSHYYTVMRGNAQYSTTTFYASSDNNTFTSSAINLNQSLPATLDKRYYYLETVIPDAPLYVDLEIERHYRQDFPYFPCYPSYDLDYSSVVYHVLGGNPQFISSVYTWNGCSQSSGTIVGSLSGGSTNYVRNPFTFYFYNSADNITWTTTTITSNSGGFSGNSAHYFRIGLPSNTMPDISTITVAVVSSGTYLSEVSNLGDKVGGFQTFVVGFGTANVTALSDFSVRASTVPFAITAATPTWTSQQVDSAINISTGQYIQFKMDGNTNLSTGTLEIDYVIWNYLNGQASAPGASLYHDGRYFLSVSTGGNVANNLALMYQRNGKWMNIEGPSYSAMTLFQNKPVAADGSVGSRVWNLFYPGVYTFDGLPINARWVSKDFNLGAPNQDKVLHRFWIEALGVPANTLTTSYLANMALPYKDKNMAFTANLLNAGVPGLFDGYATGKYFRFKFETSDPVKINAYSLYYDVNPLSH